MRILQAVILVFMAGPLLADSPNEFDSVTVGFKVTKPADWHFISAEEVLENLKRIELTDAQFHQHMLKYSTAPLVAMTKYREPFDDVNPSFRVNIKPLGQLKGQNANTILSLFIPQLKQVLPDFSLVQSPSNANVAGLPAAYVRINYSLAVPDGRKFPTTSELWIVPRGDYFFMIGAGTRQDEKTGSRDEIKSILDTIVINP